MSKIRGNFKNPFLILILLAQGAFLILILLAQGAFCITVRIHTTDCSLVAVDFLITVTQQKRFICVVNTKFYLPFPLLEKLPYLKCPLHTVLKLTPVAYGKLFKICIFSSLSPTSNERLLSCQLLLFATLVICC